jgi:hypothetical protein
LPEGSLELTALQAHDAELLMDLQRRVRVRKLAKAICSPPITRHLEPRMSEIHSCGCACGAVRYRVHGKPALAQVCHCRFCQRRLASAFAILAVFPEESVEFLQREKAECEHRSDESGRWLRMSFCPKCGTTVSHTAEVRPGTRSMAAGTFDDPDWFTIERHIWVQSKRPWVTIPAGVAVFRQGFVASPAVSGNP